MATVSAVQWCGAKSMGASPRRILTPGDTFVSQNEQGTSSSCAVVHGLHHTHYVFCRPTHSRLRGTLHLDTKSSAQCTRTVATTLHFVADLSPDATVDEPHRLSRMALSALQRDVIQWALLLFSRTTRLNCSLMDIEMAFPLLRSLPFATRVQTMVSAVSRHGCGLVLWRDNNLVCADVTSALLVQRRPSANRQRCARAMSLAAATVTMLCDMPLSELVQHVGNLHRRVQRWLWDNPVHTVAASSTVGVALLVALQVVAPFVEFPNMCPSVRACLTGNLYAVHAAGGFRSGSDVRESVAHVIRKKALKPHEFAPVFELALAGAVTPRMALTAAPSQGPATTIPATTSGDENGASTFFSSQYQETPSEVAAVQPRSCDTDVAPLRRGGVVLQLNSLALTQLDSLAVASVAADTTTRLPCLSPHVNVSTLGHVNALAPFGKTGTGEWLQLTVDPTLLK